MKYSKKIRGMSTTLAFAFVFMVFSFSFAPKVYAADAEVNVSYGSYQYYDGTAPYYILTNNAVTPVVNGSTTVGGFGGNLYTNLFFTTAPTATFTGPVKVFISFYPTLGRGTVTEQGNFIDPSTYKVSYLNAYNQEGIVNSFDLEVFASTSSATGRGYAFEIDYQGSEVNAIRSLQITRENWDDCLVVYAPYVDYKGVYYFPSIRVITSEYSAELDSLSNIADEIAAQSDLLLAMKGDIVGILQDIYEMTGDLWIAQDLTNQYLAAMLPLLEDIDQTTTNIYSLLSSQLRALETAIENAATSIEAAISAQTAAMIAYLESVLNTGNEVPDDTYQQQQDAANILDQMESLEKPNVDTIVPEIGDYTDSGVSGVLSAIFSSNLIVTMMTLSASFAFGAYVLFGKRE